MVKKKLFFSKTNLQNKSLFNNNIGVKTNSNNSLLKQNQYEILKEHATAVIIIYPTID